MPSTPLLPHLRFNEVLTRTSVLKQFGMRGEKAEGPKRVRAKVLKVGAVEKEKHSRGRASAIKGTMIERATMAALGVKWTL